ncbi:MAG: hypothetical protein ACXAC0_01955 [Candidatus Thorarchaeota archaeon]|jgi:hypothetical protein
MRNFLSGLVAITIGSFAVVLLLGIGQPPYPEPFNLIWFLLAGSGALQSTLFNPLTAVLVTQYIAIWFLIGVIIGPFSKAGWNTVRSALWTGLFLAIFALGSLLLLDSEFWGSASRNFDLLSQFVTSLILSVLALPTAIPIATLFDRIGQQSELAIPTKIEKVCECGAVFKSNPLLCSECGRELNSSEN